MDNKFSISVPSDWDEIVKACEKVSAFLADNNLDEHGKALLCHALREAMDNARRHGNGNNPDKSIRVVCQLDGDSINISVADEGPGWDYQGAVDNMRRIKPLDAARMRIAEGRVGGLGLTILLHACDEVEYVGRGNELRLTKHFAPQPA